LQEQKLKTNAENFKEQKDYCNKILPSYCKTKLSLFFNRNS